MKSENPLPPSLFCIFPSSIGVSARGISRSMRETVLPVGLPSFIEIWEEVTQTSQTRFNRSCSRGSHIFSMFYSWWIGQNRSSNEQPVYLLEFPGEQGAQRVWSHHTCAADSRAAASVSSHPPKITEQRVVTGATEDKWDTSSSAATSTSFKDTAFHSACFPLLPAPRAVVLQPWMLACITEHVLKWIHSAGENLVSAEVANRSAAGFSGSGISSVRISDALTGGRWLSHIWAKMIKIPLSPEICLCV